MYVFDLEFKLHFNDRLGQCYVKMGEYDKAIETLIGYCKELRTRGGTSAAHKQDLQVSRGVEKFLIAVFLFITRWINSKYSKNIDNPFDLG